jgi:hypothetical protein
MTYQPGDLSAIQHTIATHQTVSAEDFTAVLTANKGANYRDADFVPFVELMIGTMPGERRFGAAMEAFRRTPTHMNMFGDIRLLELARDSVALLPASQRQKANEDLLYSAPFDSRLRDEMTGVTQPSNKQPSLGAVVRNLLSGVGNPQPAMA